MTGKLALRSVASISDNQEAEMPANPQRSAPPSNGGSVDRPLALVPQPDDVDAPLFNGRPEPARTLDEAGSGCSLIDAFVQALRRQAMP